MDIFTYRCLYHPNIIFNTTILIIKSYLEFKNLNNLMSKTKLRIVQDFVDFNNNRPKGIYLNINKEDIFKNHSLIIGPDKVIANASSSKSEYSSPFGKSPTLLLSLCVV